MFRWIFVCLLLSAGAVAAVWAVAPKNISDSTSSEKPAPDPKNPEVGKAAREAAPDVAPKPAVVTTPAFVELIPYAKQKQPTAPEAISIFGATLVTPQNQDVPSEKDGKIIFIGTDVLPGEVVPPEKQLPEAKLGFLVVPVSPNEALPEGEKAFPLYENNPTQLYRRVRDMEQLEPHKIVLAFERRKVRKLQVGDKVKRGQLLALVNPRKSFEEVASRVAKLDAADWDRYGSMKQKEDMERRRARESESNRKVPGSVSIEALHTTMTQLAKFSSEEKVKAGEVIKAQRELSAALTDLKMHEIRAAIDGTVKVIYKNSEGEAVKPNESVLQIQNPGRLRAEGRLDLQVAEKLKEGMEGILEASRLEGPRLVISGHLGLVNCVAISKGKRPVVVSGSDDETLRGWDSVTGDKLWQLRGLKSAVRSVTCTPPRSKRNLVLFGCADGTVRLLDLDKINAGEKPQDLTERHQGSVNGVAFSPDGEIFATCSDDYSICLWKTETGELLHRLSQAHRGPVTSVQFASATRLVSAGHDKRLVVWDVEAGKPPHRTGPNFEGRGGEVAQIGVSPDGRSVLFDQGKELRMLSLTDKQIEGTLQNPSEAMNFSTMALFSPDGKTILTNGSAAGKLQLWRTPAQSRASELRQFVWKSAATCGAFAPEDGSFAVTGTQDHQVLVWAMPDKDEVLTPLKATLTLVEKQLDTQSRQVRVWAEVQNPGWLIPGSTATIVVPPQK